MTSSRRPPPSCPRICRSSSSVAIVGVHRVRGLARCPRAAPHPLVPHPPDEASAGTGRAAHAWYPPCAAHTTRPPRVRQQPERSVVTPPHAPRHGGEAWAARGTRQGARANGHSHPCGRHGVSVVTPRGPLCASSAHQQSMYRPKTGRFWAKRSLPTPGLMCPGRVRRGRPHRRAAAASWAR